MSFNKEHLAPLHRSIKRGQCSDDTIKKGTIS
jgi:hypothetical protein